MAFNNFQEEGEEEEAGAGWGLAIQTSGIWVVSSKKRSEREEGKDGGRERGIAEGQG